MKKIFFTFVLVFVLSFAFFNNVSASKCGDPDFVGPCQTAAPACQNTDITKSNYCLDLSTMDPMGTSNHSNQTVWGRWALNLVLQNISELLLFMIPIIMTISLIIAGYYYIFSAGDSEKTTKAKTIIKWNIIAVIVALCSLSIVQLIQSLFSFT